MTVVAAGLGAVALDRGAHGGDVVGIGTRRVDDDALDSPEVVREHLANRASRLGAVGADAAQHVRRHEEVVDVAVGTRRALGEPLARPPHVPRAHERAELHAVGQLARGLHHPRVHRAHVDADRARRA